MLAQHGSAGDVSSIIAGRDIKYDLGRAANGQIDPAVLQINLGGQGQLELIAGRDVDLQTSQGIATDANLRNVNLPETGASVSITAGLNSREPGYDAMIARYVLSDPYKEALVDSYVMKMTGDTICRRRSGGALRVVVA